jgi:hypothetical protein
LATSGNRGLTMVAPMPFKVNRSWSSSCQLWNQRPYAIDGGIEGEVVAHDTDGEAELVAVAYATDDDVELEAATRGPRSARAACTQTCARPR